MISWENKKNIRRQLMNDLGRSPTSEEYFKALAKNPMTSTDLNLENLDKIVSVGNEQMTEPTALDKELNKEKEDGKKLYAENEKLLGIDNLPTSLFPKINTFESAKDQESPEVSSPVTLPSNKANLAMSNSHESKMSSKSPVSESQGSDSEIVDNEFEAAQSEANRRKGSAMLLAAIGKMGTNIANLGNIGKPIQDNFADTAKTLEQQSDDPISQLKSKRDQYEAMLKNKELKDMSNPSSDISMAARDLVRSMGMKVDENATAMQLNKVLPYLNQKYNVDEAKKARAERLQLAKMEREDKNKDRHFDILKNDINKYLATPEVKMYNNSKNAANAVKYAIQSGSPQAKGSAFMQYAKLAQGDDSIVRESDIQMLSEKYGLNPNTVSKLFSRTFEGTQLSNQEMREMAKVIQAHQAETEERVKNRFATLLKQKEHYGLDKVSDEALIPAEYRFNDVTAKTQFPKQVRKDGHVATVNNEKELQEALAEGWR